MRKKMRLKNSEKRFGSTGNNNKRGDKYSDDLKNYYTTFLKC
jgi:hypothetical protein